MLLHSFHILANWALKETAPAQPRTSPHVTVKKIIFNTVNSGHSLFFGASASYSKTLNVKVYSIQWQISGQTLLFRVSAELLKNPE